MSAGSAKVVLNRWVKLFSSTILFVGLFGTITGAYNLYFWNRLVLGLTAVAVGSWGLKTSFGQQANDAKMLYYGLLFFIATSLLVNLIVIFMSTGMSTTMCNQAEVKIQDKDDCVTTTKAQIVTISVVLLLVSVCLVSPCAYVARRYWQALEVDGPPSPLLVG